MIKVLCIMEVAPFTGYKIHCLWISEHIPYLQIHTRNGNTTCSIPQCMFCNATFGVPQRLLEFEISLFCEPADAIFARGLSSFSNCEIETSCAVFTAVPSKASELSARLKYCVVYTVKY